MKSERKSELGEVFLITEMVELLYDTAEEGILTKGDIVISLGVEIEGETLYLTSSGSFGTLPNDETFFTHESRKI